MTALQLHPASPCCRADTFRGTLGRFWLKGELTEFRPTGPGDWHQLDIDDVAT